MDRDPADPEAGGPVDEKMIAIRRRAANFRREQEMHGYVALYSEEDREYLLDRIAELERALAEFIAAEDAISGDALLEMGADAKVQRWEKARRGLRAALGRGGGGG